MATENKQAPTTTRRRTSAAKKSTPKAKPASNAKQAKPSVATQQAKRDAAGADRLAASLTVTDQVLAQLGTTGQSAIGAVRHFLDQVDSALLPEQERPSGAHDVIDSALEMSGVLVANGTETIRGLVRSTGDAIH